MGFYNKYFRKNDSLKYNESKGEIEFDQDTVLNSPKNHLHNPKIISSRTYNKVDNSKVSEDTRSFNREARIRRNQKAFMESLNERKKNQGINFNKIIPWIFLLFIIFVVSKVIYKNSNEKQFTNTSQQIEQSASIVEPIVAIETLPTPLTSVLSTTYDTTTSTCPLTIIADSSNYYVKLFTISDNKTVATFFIRAGETLEIKIPAGEYAVKYGSGNEWKGEQELFGQFAQYGRSEALAFYYDGFSSQGHTISLYKSTNGNFQTDNVDRDYVLQN